MNNTQLAALAHRAGFGERTENQIHIEEFVKLKKFAEMVLAQRAWTSLTDEEMWNAYTGGSDIINLDYAKAIQNKLKEKNT